MAERKYTHGLKLKEVEGVTLVDIGSMEIWDGADLSLIRDTLFRIVLDEGVESIGINMRFVQYVPSGFFGMLYDWMERGVEVRLYSPQQRIQQMLWFRKFCTPVSQAVFRLHENQGFDDENHDEPQKSVDPAVTRPNRYSYVG